MAPRVLSSVRTPWLMLTCGAVLTLASACDDARSSSPVPPPPPAAPVALRCGDLLTANDLAAAGVDPANYDPDKRAESGMGVHCVVGSPSVSLFAGDQYAVMIDGLQNMGPQAGVTAAAGPSVGSASQWTSMGPMNGLMFLGSNRGYAANLSGPDKAQVEQLARAIDARMSKR